MLACFGYILFCFHSDHKLNQYGKLVLELVSLKSIRILLIKTITRFSNVTINTAKVTKKCDYFCTDEHAQTQHRGYLVLLVHIFISNTVKSLQRDEYKACRNGLDNVRIMYSSLCDNPRQSRRQIIQTNSTSKHSSKSRSHERLTFIQAMTV
jgi:hypothetical protein